MEKTKISILTPVYNEAENVLDCYQAVKKVFETELSDYSYEHIFADNASLDNTVQILKEIAQKDKNVKIIINSRNFGASRSSFNSLKYASGDAVIYTIAADLQDPPELIPEFIANWKEGYKVVYGIRETREEKRFLTFVRKKYYRLIQRFSEFNIPTDVGDFQLLDRVIVDNLLKVDDYFPYVRGLIARTGFSSKGIKYKHLSRKKGKAKGNYFALLDLGLNGLVSFTHIPLRIAMILGVLLSFSSITYALVQFIIWFINTVILDKESIAQPGLTTLVLSMFFFFGIILFFIGILGEYIGAIHSQIRKGPLVIVEETVNIE